MKIGILGGTFDPIHQGHLALARQALEQFALDKVLFVPAFVSPHKLDREDVTAADHRRQMVALAIEDEPAFELCEVELNRREISYTADTLEELKQLYPSAEFYLIIGADSLLQFDRWKEPGKIKENAHLLVAPRPGCEIDALLGDGISKIDMSEHNVSSSDIRTTVSEHQSVADELLPKVVLYYIEKMNLYSKEN